MEAEPARKPEKMGHRGTDEDGPFRGAIFGKVHILLNHIARGIDKIAIEIGDMLFVLLDHLVMPGWRLEPVAPT
jgi:hypothetical protein